MGIKDGLHIVVDENIRRGEAAFSGFGEVRTMSGRDISSFDLSNVDILLVRSVTPIDEHLLSNSRVQFVGSATTGTDHVDQRYLERAGIAFAHAPGGNADSVVEYVIAALLELAIRRGVSLESKVAGIVGCGQIGHRLAQRLSALGCEVLKNDPPLADRAEGVGRSHDFLSLDIVLREADVVTFHTPLTKEAPYTTFHLIGEGELASLKESAWLINTCRGAVVDNEALLRSLERDRLAEAVLDVWEDEPEPAPELVEQCSLATPHIAGYSYDGKLNGTIMLYKALEEYLETEGGWDYESELELEDKERRLLEVPPATLSETEWLHRLVEQMYEIREDDRRMRQITELAAGARGDYFTELRRTYPKRRGFSNFAVSAGAVPPARRRMVSAALDIQLQ